MKLVILGEGSQRQDLESMALRLGIRDSVIMPGFVDNPWSYLAKASMFVLPSWWEGFGNVVIEAMACEIPVVVTDCDFGPNEIVQHEHTGLIVPPGDTDALGKAITSLLDDPDKAQHLATQGRQRASAFDQSVIMKRYEALFREVHQGA
jgi:GalNAc-alpha-(1->4)-GalNAc-alpha-(1->3)-diNAcBac-PP-undecaprenol alpha-1,4-N-acetyl-D-galactosaminyltransferase